MSLVETMYRAAVDRMTPADKIARMVEMNRWAHGHIARQVTEEQGPQSSEALKWEVALRLYGRNPTCRRLIEERLSHVRSG